MKFPHPPSCPGQSDGENGASATRCPTITIIQTHTHTLMIIGTRREVFVQNIAKGTTQYESIATVGEIRVWWRADFQSGSRVLKKVF